MKHWEECTKCGEVKVGTLQAHTYGTYTDNEDGTHSATCSKCGYKLTEEHKAGEKCPDCGNSVQKPGEDNNNQNNDNNQNNSNNQSNNNQNNGDKTDNTVVDKNIPYTGIKSIGFIAIFAFAVVGIISAVKMKKYKNIK